MEGVLFFSQGLKKVFKSITFDFQKYVATLCMKRAHCRQAAVHLSTRLFTPPLSAADTFVNVLTQEMTLKLHVPNITPFSYCQKAEIAAYNLAVQFIKVNGPHRSIYFVILYCFS